MCLCDYHLIRHTRFKMSKSCESIKYRLFHKVPETINFDTEKPRTCQFTIPDLHCLFAMYSSQFPFHPKLNYFFLNTFALPVRFIFLTYNIGIKPHVTVIIIINTNIHGFFYKVLNDDVTNVVQNNHLHCFIYAYCVTVYYIMEKNAI